MSGTAKPEARPWDGAQYQRLTEARGNGYSLEVSFEDGTDIAVDIRRLLGDDIPTPDWSTLEVEDYELSLSLDGDAVELPWLDIRALSDPAFGAFLAERASQRSERVGLSLRLLREKRGFTAKELAERAGLSPQSLSRIERGRHDVVFSTLQRLLGAMNYGLTDLADVEKPAIDITQVERALADVGLQKRTMARILFGTNSAEEVVARLRRLFQWTPTDLAGSNPPPVLSTGALSVRFKQQAKDREASPAYVAWAYQIACIAERAIERPVYSRPSDAPALLAGEVKARYGDLSFDAVASYAWERGMIVMPLADRGQFHGACWLINETPVIALKQGLAQNSRWVFDLLHEILHVLRHLKPEQPAIIELGEIDYASEQDESLEDGEHEASAFAGEVLLGDPESLTHEAIEEANRDLRRLKATIPVIAQRHDVDVGCLANYVAKRVSEEGYDQRIWGVAQNLQKGQDQAPEIAHSLFVAKVDWKSLDLEDQAILRGALCPEAELQ